MAKKFWGFLVQLVMILSLVTTGFITPASAETVPYADIGVLTSFTEVGGDGDQPLNSNSLFVQIVDDRRLADMCVFNFIPSVSGDYSNSTAINQALEAERYTKLGYGKTCVAAYSHGGQSIYFMDMTVVDELFLIDATSKIQKVCDNPDTVGTTWADWIIAVAANGTNVHIYATNDSRDISTGSRNAISNIERYASNNSYRAMKGVVLQKVGEGSYVVSCNGKVGTIECVFLGGTHEQACVNAARYIFPVVGT